MHGRAGSESLHVSDKLTHWSAKCCGAKYSDITTIEANAIEGKSSFFHLPNLGKVNNKGENSEKEEQFLSSPNSVTS